MGRAVGDLGGRVRAPDRPSNGPRLGTTGGAPSGAALPYRELGSRGGSRSRYVLFASGVRLVGVEVQRQRQCQCQRQRQRQRRGSDFKKQTEKNRPHGLPFRAWPQSPSTMSKPGYSRATAAPQTHPHRTSSRPSPGVAGRAGPASVAGRSHARLPNIEGRNDLWSRRAPGSTGSCQW